MVGVVVKVAVVAIFVVVLQEEEQIDIEVGWWSAVAAASRDNSIQ